MKKKDFAAKLAAGVRQARHFTPPTASTDATSAGSGRQSRFARQADQTPPPSLDRPWENLHPERIWPD